MSSSRRTFFRRLLGAAGSFAAGYFVLQPGSATGADNAEREVSSLPAVDKWRSLLKSDWAERLTAEQFRILREEGTEYAHTSPLNDENRAGTFHCAGCDLSLFSSETKYDSRTGWPSFWAPINETHVGTRLDFRLIFPRTEVHCARCLGHLGHLFDDGPPPTGLRYCINGIALTFQPKA